MVSDLIFYFRLKVEFSLLSPWLGGILNLSFVQGTKFDIENTGVFFLCCSSSYKVVPVVYSWVYGCYGYFG